MGKLEKVAYLGVSQGELERMEELLKEEKFAGDVFDTWATENLKRALEIARAAVVLRKWTIQITPFYDKRGSCIMISGPQKAIEAIEDEDLLQIELLEVDGDSCDSNSPEIGSST